jgi:hypothetical protein
VALDERSLSSTTVADQDTFECGDIAFCCHFCLVWICRGEKRRVS